MPELPEVENVVRSLKNELLDRRIISVRVIKPLVLKTPADHFHKRVNGQTIRAISRHGKSIFLSLSSGEHLKIHLGMSGALLFRGKREKSDPYVRVLFELDHPELDLAFRDVRQFGKVLLSSEAREKTWGPDAWTSTDAQVYAALRAKKGMVKHALLNQLVIAGVGNIYADESLFRAKIHPAKKLERVKDSRLKDLCGSLRAVLGNSIASGGTTFRDYRNAQGKRGKFTRRLNVYARKGKPCPDCGTPIKKIVVASRGTHFCPNCQKR